MSPSKLLILCLLLASPVHLWAQELSPRAYWPAPKGTQILTLGAVFSDGDTVPDPSLPITGVNSEISTLVVGYLRTVELWGRTSNFVIELPYSQGDTSGSHLEDGLLSRDYEGAGDLAATLSVNLMGAPSMNPQQFADLRRNPHPILGASLRVVAPTGRYDSDNVINVGSNRWAAKAELGYIGLLSPKWHYEAQLGGWVFADNDDFLGMRKEQDPLWALELHLVRRFRPGLWASLDANFYTGGRTRVNGQRLDDLQRDTKVGFTLVYPFAGFGGVNSVKLGYHFGSVNNSDEEFNVLSLSYMRLF